jgi:hypothetical protein
VTDDKQAHAVALALSASEKSAFVLEQWALVEAQSMIEQHADVFHALIDVLLASETGGLSGEQVDEIILEVATRKARARELQRRAKWCATLERAAEFEVTSPPGVIAPPRHISK